MVMFHSYASFSQRGFLQSSSSNLIQPPGTFLLSLPKRLPGFTCSNWLHFLLRCCGCVAVTAVSLHCFKHRHLSHLCHLCHLYLFAGAKCHFRLQQGIPLFWISVTFNMGWWIHQWLTLNRYLHNFIANGQPFSSRPQPSNNDVDITTSRKNWLVAIIRYNKSIVWH